MINTINQKTVKDIDVYGRDDYQGNGLVHQGDFAISNAIILYLSSEQDDYLFKPKTGAGLKRYVFKLMSNFNGNKIAKYITTNIQNKFGGLITNVKVSVTADFENRIQTIDIFYQNIVTGKTSDIVFYAQIPQNLIPKQIVLPNNYGNKISIDFIGDNLLAFIMLKMNEVPQTERLQFDKKSGYWYWEQYQFIKLTKDSPEFLEVQALIG